jgi:hypothetical protein
MANARLDLSSQIRTKVQGIFKSFSSKSGLGEDKALDQLSESMVSEVVKEELRGATLKETWISPENELFVMLTVDNEKVVETLKSVVEKEYSSSGKNTNASERSKELEREINNYFKDNNELSSDIEKKTLENKVEEEPKKEETEQVDTTE